MGVKRLYVEKKDPFRNEAHQLFQDLTDHLELSGLQQVRILNRYDVEGLTNEVFEAAKHTIFSEPMVDHVFEEILPVDDPAQLFAIELLPGQYDQRADSAAQCVQLLTQDQRPEVAYARLIVLEGNVSPHDLEKVKQYLINPVESREASLEKPPTLKMNLAFPDPVPIITGFTKFPEEALYDFLQQHGLAMTLEDLVFCQAYFRDTEDRDPTVTEIRMIDTYWSDHCRHTTFLTEITDVSFEAGDLNEPAREAWTLYQQSRETVHGKKGEDKPACLMDLAVMAMKEMRRQGTLPDLEVSEEINACSIIVPAIIDGREEEWLVMFKNETHNHPTEIEPFGGAATCLGAPSATRSQAVPMCTRPCGLPAAATP